MTRAGRIVAVPLLVGLLAGIVRAISIVEFSIPTTNADLRGIAAGSDGNIWFTEYLGNKIGRITPSGVIAEFSLPTANSFPGGITAGPDGNLWFTETSAIGRITVTGMITQFPLPNPGDYAESITVGPDGNLWFTEFTSENHIQIVQLGRITTSGVISWFSPSCKFDTLGGIAAGPDGNLWLEEASSATASLGKIGRVNPTTGSVTEFCLCVSPLPEIGGITTGPDGNMWFNAGSQIGRITTMGAITQFPVPTNQNPIFSGTGSSIALGPDGNLWFTDWNGNNVGRINTTGTITEFPIPTNGSVSGAIPRAITAGPDATLWFTIHGSQYAVVNGVNQLVDLPLIGRIYVGPPRLTVIKRLIPAGDAGRFNLQIDGVTQQPTNVGDGGTTGPWVLAAGSHTVSESGGTKADGTPTDLGLYKTQFGGDCASNGSITLANGDEKTCTITNTYPSPVCQSPLVLCGNQCVDLNTSRKNCGACGNSCSTGEACQNGQCGGCPAGTTLCCGGDLGCRAPGKCPKQCP